MKDTDHPIRHPWVHLGIEQVPEGEDVAHDRRLDLAAGKTPCWAGATPLLQTVPWPK